jgi:ParB family chromosome partitioning protein
MTAPKPGIGRGLAAILAASEGSNPAEGVRELAIDSISPNPRQPRRRLDEQALHALADSFGEQGVLQPVLVRPKGAGYELIAGERRWRAAALAGIEKIPALVRSAADAETLELALIENMAREDLNPVEEARACAALADELGLTREQIAKRVGRSRVAISNLVRLLELPDEVLELLETRELSEGHGRALLMAEDHDTRRRLARTVAREGWSVRVTERRARATNTAGHNAANSGDPDSASLAAATAGASSELHRHPDREAAAQSIADSLEAVLGTGVRVRHEPRKGYIAELSFASHEEALALARRLRPRSVA